MNNSSLNSINWPDVLNKVQSFATSETAKEELLQLSPLPSMEKAYERFAKIDNATYLLQQGTRPFMESLDFFIPWFTRLKKGATLKTIEIKDVRLFCQETLSLKELIQNIEDKEQHKWLQFLEQEIFATAEPLSAIDSTITIEGGIRSDASEKLHQLLKEKNHLARQVSQTLDQLSKAHNMEPVLQDKYVTTREGRWVLPVKGGMQHDIEGIIHASSNSKQTVFMEPQEIIPINNRIRKIEIEIDEEIQRILKELSQYLCSQVDDFEKTFHLLKEIDVTLSLARFCQSIQAHPPTFKDKEIELREVRHPLLVFEQSTSNSHLSSVVANDIHLNEENKILLLSGPNAGGKTVLLKSIGLAAQMARCGLPICAEAGSTLPFFENLEITVGDAQSVDEHLSTFAAHLQLLNSGLQHKGPKTLILVDEICGSTDPEEGSAIARSFIESYAENKVYSVITSHLSALKRGWGKESKIINGSLKYDTENNQPTYQFLQGIAGESLALQTAKRVGVNEAVINKALTHLSPEARQRLKGMEDIESLKAELIASQQQLQKERKEINKAKSHYQTLVDKFEKQKQAHLEGFLQKTENKIDDMISNTKVEQIFRKHEALHQIKNKLPEMVKAPTSNKETSSLNSAEDFAKKYPPGAKVFVTQLKQDGIVQGVPNQKGLLPVMANSLRLMLKWQELLPPKAAQNSTGKILRQSGHSHQPLAVDGGTRTVDLRGLRVEEALETLETELDQAIVQQEDRVKIVHGHGTEALKKAVRSYLSRSLYVQKWFTQAKKERGDSGATWVELQGQSL